MKKKFVSVMVFSAMVLATTPALVSCSDYDDDVDNLQEQIDKITGEAPVSQAALDALIAKMKAEYEEQLNLAVSGKADNSAVIALQETVRELNEALANKADAETISSLMEQINTLVTEVNTVKGSLDETKTELKGEIAEVQKKLEAAAEASKTEIMDVLNVKVGELNALLAELQGTAGDNKEAIEAVQGKIASINTAIENAMASDEELKNKFNDLKTQLDKLQGSDNNNKEAIEAAQEKIAAIENKIATIESTMASDEELNNKFNELKTVLAELQGSDSSNKEAIGALQDKITGIENTMANEAEALNQYKETLAERLTTMNNKLADVETMAKNNGQAIAELTQKVADLENLTTTVSGLDEKLQAANEAIKTLQDNSATKAELLAAQDAITKMDGTVGEILKRLDGIDQDLANLATTETLTNLEKNLKTYAETVAKNAEVAANQATSEALTELKKDYDFIFSLSSDYFTQLDANLRELKAYKDAVLTHIFGGKLPTEEIMSYAAVVSKLGELEGNFANYVSKEDFEAFENDLATVKNDLKDLGLTLKAMIQSIVYVPEYTDGKVMFESLFFDWVNGINKLSAPIIRSDNQKIKFRITPAAAAKDFVDNYDITFDGEIIKTRGIDEKNNYITVIDKKVFEKEGIVEFTVTTPQTSNPGKDENQKERYYSLCMLVTPSDKNTTDNLTNLSSNYFTMGINEIHINRVEVVSDNNVKQDINYTTLTGDGCVDYKKGRKFIGSNNGKDQIDLEKKFPSLKEGTDYTVEYTVDNDKVFQVGEDGVLSLTPEKVNKLSAIDQEANVTATFKFAKASSASTTTYQTVTAKEFTQVFTYAIDKGKGIDIQWNEAGEIEVDHAAILDLIGMSEAEFAKISGSTSDYELYEKTAGIKIGTNNHMTLQWDKFLTVSENGCIVSATFQLSEKKTLKVTATLNRTQYPSAQIELNSTWWTNNNSNVEIKANEEKDDKGRITAIKLTQLNVSQLFSNYNQETIDELKKMDATYSINVLPAEIPGVSYNSTEGTLNVTIGEYKGDRINVDATIATSDKHALANHSGIILVPNFGGTWTVGNKAHTASNVVDAIDLTKGCTWKSEKGGLIMWQDGRVFDGTKTSDKFATNPLTIYGLTAPTFNIIEDKDDLATVDESKGILTFNSKAKDYVFQKDYVIKVEVTVDASHGTIAGDGKSTIITITIPAEKK